MNIRRIIISRTDSIGDVMLTLPMCGMIKKHFPDCLLAFIGKSYTQAVIESCTHVDRFINCDLPEQEVCNAIQSFEADTIIHVFPDKAVMAMAKKLRIAQRIATGHRLATWKYCNKPVFFSRKNSPLHEAQLNMKLLSPLGIRVLPGYEEIASLYGFTRFVSMPPDKKRVILHPLSKGSAVEWGIAHFRSLALMLAEMGYEVAITGTADEGKRIAEQGGIEGKNITNYCGRWNLNELISFIASSFALVAASTGPLHIAAASGVHSIGLYTPMRPMHPGRWAPIGKNAHVLVADKHPSEGEKLDINPSDVAKLLERLSANS